MSKRKAQNMNPVRSQKLNRFIVSDYFKKLESVLEVNNVSLSLKWTKRVVVHVENTTVVACINALGNAIPPMVLIKGMGAKPTFEDGLPADAVISMSPKEA